MNGLNGAERLMSPSRACLSFLADWMNALVIELGLVCCCCCGIESKTGGINCHMLPATTAFVSFPRFLGGVFVQ